MPDILEQLIASTKAQTFTGDDVREKIKTEAEMKTHRRNQGFQDTMHKAMCIAVWVAAISIISMGVVWVIHIITPWGWLCPDQLDTIKNTLFSGAIGGLIADRLRKF